MDKWPELLTETYEIVRRPVELLDEQLLQRPTPCTEWSVGDVFEHLIGAVEMFAGTAGAPDRDRAVGGTPVERFDASVARSLAAWRSLAPPPGTLSLPFGTFPAEVVAGMNQMDSLIHGWDIGAALGLTVALPDNLAEAALQTAQVSVPPFRGHGFGNEVTPVGDKAGERLLAFTGRNTTAWSGAIWVGGSLVSVKTAGGDGTPASAVEIWEAEGSGPPRHVHAEQDELWYVLEGRFTFALGDREFQAGPGEVIVGPRGVAHTFRADTAHSRLLDIHTPGGFERFFVHAGAPASALVPPSPKELGDPTDLLAKIESFGAKVVGPPLGA